MWAMVWKTIAAARDALHVPLPQMKREIVEFIQLVLGWTSRCLQLGKRSRQSSRGTSGEPKRGPHEGGPQWIVFDI